MIWFINIICYRQSHFKYIHKCRYALLWVQMQWVRFSKCWIGRIWTRLFSLGTMHIPQYYLHPETASLKKISPGHIIFLQYICWNICNVFDKDLYKRLAEFNIITLLLRRHLCFCRARTTAVHWDAMPKRTFIFFTSFHATVACISQ